MTRTVIRNGYLSVGGRKRKRRRRGKLRATYYRKRYKGRFGALGAIGAQIVEQIASNLINKIF